MVYRIPGFSAANSLREVRVTYQLKGPSGPSEKGELLPAANDCPLKICNKVKNSSRCAVDSAGYWRCQSGNASDTCYEEWYSDGNCKPTAYAACASSKRYPLCQ